MQVIYYADKHRLEGRIAIVRFGETFDEAVLRIQAREIMHTEEISGNIIEAIHGLLSIDETRKSEEDFISALMVISKLPLRNSKIWEIFTNPTEVESLVTHWQRLGNTIKPR